MKERNGHHTREHNRSSRVEASSSSSSTHVTNGQQWALQIQQGNRFLLKVCILGPSGVGKSAFSLMLSEKKFYSEIEPTVGAEFVVSLIPVDQKVVKFQIWDLAGLERFRSITSTYYGDAAILFFMLDDTHRCWEEEGTLSCDVSSHFLEMIKAKAEGSRVVVLINEKDTVLSKTQRTKMKSRIQAFDNGEHIKSIHFISVEKNCCYSEGISFLEDILVAEGRHVLPLVASNFRQEASDTVRIRKPDFSNSWLLNKFLLPSVSAFFSHPAELELEWIKERARTLIDEYISNSRYHSLKDKVINVINDLHQEVNEELSEEDEFSRERLWYLVLYGVRSHKTRTHFESHRVTPDLQSEIMRDLDSVILSNHQGDAYLAASSK